MNRRRTLLLGWTLAVVAMLAFAAAGRWQLERMQQKQQMLDAADLVLAARVPRAISDVRGSAGSAGFDWVAVEGAFAEAPAVLLDNQSRGERPGVRAYRLFQPDGGSPLLVELGWLPLSGDRRMPVVQPIAGRQRLQGLWMPPPSAGLLAGTASALPDGTLLTTAIDATALPALLRQTSLPRRVLRLDPATPLGYARDLDILPNTLPPQRHLGYAVQWFALALAVLVTALLLTFRKARRTA